MTGLATVVLLLGFLAFAAGAIGVQARVSWDQAGKACVVLAALAQWAPVGR